MAYFEYLRRTGLEYGPESYVMYLTEVCGYTEMYAKSMACLQFGNEPKSVTETEIWSPVSMGDAMFIGDQIPNLSEG